MENQMAINSINLQNVDYSGIRILLVSPKSEVYEGYETRSELDSELDRIDIYQVSDLEAAKGIVRNYLPQIAILVDNTTQSDTRDTINELVGLNQKINFVLVGKIADLSLIRHAISSGNLLDIVDIDSISTYEKFKSQIFDLLRRYSVKTENDSSQTDRLISISNALIHSSEELKKINSLQSLICPKLLKVYDISVAERKTVTLASYVYIPSLRLSDYEAILSSQGYDVLKVLDEAGNENTEPKSTQGFVIKMSRFLAEKINDSSDLDGILNAINSRPKGLKHPSIRVINRDLIEQIFKSINVINHERDVIGE